MFLNYNELSEPINKHLNFINLSRPVNFNVYLNIRQYSFLLTALSFDILFVKSTKLADFFGKLAPFKAI